MKTRVTISIDPGLLREARAVARQRKTTLSALVEELLEQATRHDALHPVSFSQKWGGRFELHPSDGDPLRNALKDKYGLG